ncbi:MAG: DUF6065 family protein [Anaerolineae bacterium]|jgi:hypothetical protein|nr:DUF6065 family protein [Anaerolineae bacterium]
MSDDSDLRLIAYRTSAQDVPPIIPAPRHRTWMDNTHEHFAYRCLPLLMANQAGWFILNPHAFQATWSGKRGLPALRIEYADGQHITYKRASSHFGYGILTFGLPYLFRTPPGYNLLARGPANLPKDGIVALEGLIETDWSSASFTMNWQITRPHHPIIFEKDEPICMITPQKRGELEAFQPSLQPIERDPALNALHQKWGDSRRDFLAALEKPGARDSGLSWQKDYFRGQLPDNPAPQHQIRLEIRPFAVAGDE